MKSKVVIGMSGGVDSSVAAAFLIDKGYDVVGLTMKTRENPHDKCGSDDAAVEAKKIADALGIEHHTIDAVDDFKNIVIDYFINEYKNGRTPNPCVVCNPAIKFKLLLEHGARYGAEYIATGHYADVDCVDGTYMLKNAEDAKKDQTYMLYSLNQEQLSKTLFPLAHITKDKAREYAKMLNLSVADKPDSQDICFIPDGNYARFIHENSDYEDVTGDYVDEDGNILGKHKGLIHYTIGQRKGLGIAFGKPTFVLGIDAKHNRVILGDNDRLFKKSLFARDVSFVSGKPIDDPFRTEAKIRYAAKRDACTVFPDGENRVRVEFDEAQRAVTPGQAVVFYDGKYVIGGGIIEG